MNDEESVFCLSRNTPEQRSNLFSRQTNYNTVQQCFLQAERVGKRRNSVLEP